MILTCPSCGTQYVVKDGAIPPEGRQVRCASCKHSWHQDPEPGDQTETEVEPAGGADSRDPNEADAHESLAEATMIEPRSGPEAEERAYEEALVEDAASTSTQQEAIPEADPDEAPVASPPNAEWQNVSEDEGDDDRFSPFASETAPEPRRRGTLLPIIAVVIAVIVIAAGLWFIAPPEWKARLGLAAVGTSPLALVTTHMDRVQLESGNELLTVTGRVINPTAAAQDVPPLRAQLKTRTGKVVYSWTIAPPTRTLAAGASAKFNSAEVNVPPGGDELTISLGSAGV